MVTGSLPFVGEDFWGLWEQDTEEALRCCMCPIFEMGKPLEEMEDALDLSDRGSLKEILRDP